MLDRITAINGTTFWIALAAVHAGAQLDSTPVMVTASLILLGSTATAILTTRRRAAQTRIDEGVHDEHDEEDARVG